jgi:hypothetical protein
VIPQKIGLWGSSYSGGHAIVLGATDRRLRCVVAQVPTISGYEQSLRRVAPEKVAALEESFSEDERALFRGELPKTQPRVARAARSRAVDDRTFIEEESENERTGAALACRVGSGDVDEPPGCGDADHS